MSIGLGLGVPALNNTTLTTVRGGQLGRCERHGEHNASDRRIVGYRAACSTPLHRFIGEATRVVFVNVHVDRPWEDPNETVLAWGATRCKSVVVADWITLAARIHNGSGELGPTWRSTVRRQRVRRTDVDRIDRYIGLAASGVAS
jgi:hypothetical protein